MTMAAPQSIVAERVHACNHIKPHQYLCNVICLIKGCERIEFAIVPLSVYCERCVVCRARMNESMSPTRGTAMRRTRDPSTKYDNVTRPGHRGGDMSAGVHNITDVTVLCKCSIIFYTQRYQRRRQ